MMYTKEQDLVDNFIGTVECDSPWGEILIGTEFPYSRGRADIVILSGNESIIAIEAKLTHWRRALQQAYRNSCFADENYVLLPKTVAINAFRHEQEFDKRGVGICSYHENKIEIVKVASKVKPLQPWLNIKAKEYISEVFVDV